MFILDTDVISELRKVKSGKAHPNVAAWSAKLAPTHAFISAISVLELERGILQIERRDATQGAVLRAWMDEHVLPTFAGRILPIDAAVAQRCAKLHVPNPKPERDALIAATALVHGFIVATRNTDDFIRTNVEIVNPWDQQT